MFYVQYAHARVCSVLNKAQEAGLVCDDVTLATADTSLLTHPAELALAQKLAEWPRLLETAAKTHEPHRIAFYLYELASEFHALQHLGKIEPEMRFIQVENAAQSLARIALIRAVAVAIAAGLGILGVTPAKEMR